MDEVARDAGDVLVALDQEQMLLVLAYARCLRDGIAALNVDGLDERLREEPA